MLLHLYSSHSNLCDLGQVQAQVEGHWPDLFLITSSPGLYSAGDKITRGNCSLSLVLYYRCFWPIPVTCIISLTQGRRQNCTHLAEKDDSVLMEQDFISESYKQTVKFQFLETCAYPLRNKAGLSLSTRHILVHLKLLPSVLLTGV